MNDAYWFNWYSALLQYGGQIWFWFWMCLHVKNLLSFKKVVMELFHWRVKSLGLARQFRLDANQICQSFSRKIDCAIVEPYPMITKFFGTFDYFSCSTDYLIRLTSCLTPNWAPRGGYTDTQQDHQSKESSLKKAELISSSSSGYSSGIKSCDCITSLLVQKWIWVKWRWCRRLKQ